MSLPAALPLTEAADCLLVFDVCEFFFNVYSVWGCVPGHTHSQGSAGIQTDYVRVWEFFFGKVACVTVAVH